MNILKFFKKEKRPPFPTPRTEEEQIPLAVRSVVPQEYLNKTKSWDSDLYKNKEIIKTEKDENRDS